MDVLISPDAISKQAQLAYEGKSYKLLLAYRNGAVLTQNSLMSAWNAVKLTVGNGYAEQTGTIGTGSFNTGNARYELPEFSYSLTATGSGYIFDTILLQVDNRTYPDRVMLLPTPETLQSGQSKSYVLMVAVG